MELISSFALYEMHIYLRIRFSIRLGYKQVHVRRKKSIKIVTDVHSTHPDSKSEHWKLIHSFSLAMRCSYFGWLCCNGVWNRPIDTRRNKLVLKTWSNTFEIFPPKNTNNNRNKHNNEMQKMRERKSCARDGDRWSNAAKQRTELLLYKVFLCNA